MTKTQRMADFYTHEEWTTNEIAEHFECSRQNVSAALRRAGVATRRQRLETRSCLKCEAEFKPRNREQKFCSRPCAFAHRREATLSTPPAGTKGERAYTLRAETGMRWRQVAREVGNRNIGTTIATAREFATRHGRPWPIEVPEDRNDEG